MKAKKTKSFSRRDLMKAVGFGLPLSYFLFPKTSSNAQTSTPKRFVQFFLAGGWDTLLATDPPRSTEKQNSSAFDSTYLGQSVTQIPGKSNLFVGPGLSPAAAAFQSMNTAFINGMYVEVTAHELATKYLFSGRATLSRSREFPALTALMGDAAQAFPPHLNLGISVPLGDTKSANPPLHAVSTDHLNMMLSGPRSSDFYFNDNAIAQMHGLIDSLNQVFAARINSAQNARLNGWRAAGDRLSSLYEARYDQSMELSSEVIARYSVSESWQLESLTASAFMALQTGLASYISVHAGGYDTHNNHFSAHLPLMQSFATALNTFVTDLQSTPDPDDSSLTLAQTTTILVTSEFSRTPTLNLAAGTDHWPSASAILMGEGVRDNTVVGQTGTDGYALGWSGSAPQDFSDATALQVGTVYSGLLRHMGFDAAAATLSDTDTGNQMKDELFTS